MLQAEIHITLKNTVADPQGTAVQKGLATLGYPEVREVRVGKLLHLNVDAADQKTAHDKVEAMCRKMLANTIIEDYSFTIKEI